MDTRAEDLLKDAKKYKEGSYLGALGVRPIARKMEQSITALNGQLRVLQELKSGLPLVHLIEAMNSLELYKPTPGTWKIKDYLGPPPLARQAEEEAKRVYEEIQLLIGETRKM